MNGNGAKNGDDITARVEGIAVIFASKESLIPLRHDEVQDDRQSRMVLLQR